MKRTLAIFLALVTLVGCGTAVTTTPEVPAQTAEAVTEAAQETATKYMVAPAGSDGETVTLRAGEIREVENADEFLAAYKAIYEDNSTVSGIRLLGDFNVYTKTLRTEGGKDPYMSAYSGTLCIRMPEGTCLDLNGHTLALRANQGLDDSGTGTPSGNLSLGKIVDTANGGTGALNFYIIPTAEGLAHALKVQEANPEFVRIISVSEEITDAQDSEYIIPSHVCLKFSGKASAVNAKCITFRPTATSVLAHPDTAQGLKNCAKVVFEYQDEADKAREGSEFAAETVQGTAAAELVTKKYFISASDAAAVTAEVPVIENSSVETTEAAVLKTASAAPYTLPESYTKEQKQQVIVETAFAYYYHNPDVQYDGRTMVENDQVYRIHDSGTPEMAEIDTPVYSVCSNFTFKSYIEGFDYHLLGGSKTCSTKSMTKIKVGDPVLVYKYAGTQDDGEKDLQKAIAESRKVLEPGDIITGYGSSGHAMIYIGDACGDGQEYVLHCWGKSYTKEDGIDYREEAGSIKLQTVDRCCYTEGAASPSWYLGKEACISQGFTIYRPVNDPEFPAMPTTSGAMRLIYPRMEIRRTLDRNLYIDAMEGEEIPVTVTVTNHSTQDYAELPIVENLPEGAVYIDGSATAGAAPQNGQLLWSVKIPAGKSIALTYKVKLTAKQGETVTFPAGTVGSIPSRVATLRIGGQPLSELQEYGIQNCAEALAGTKTETFEDLAFFTKFYKEAIGMDIELPQTTQELLDAISEKYEVGDLNFRKLLPTTAENAKLMQMMLPLHFTGLRVPLDGDPWSRVREHRTAYYKPGDIFVGIYGTNMTDVIVSSDIVLYMYVGGGNVMWYGTDGSVKVGTFNNTLGRIMNCNVLIGLRPTLAR